MNDTLTTIQSSWDSGEPFGYAMLLVTLLAGLVYQFSFARGQ